MMISCPGGEAMTHSFIGSDLIPPLLPPCLPQGGYPRHREGSLWRRQRTEAHSPSIPLWVNEIRSNRAFASAAGGAPNALGAYPFWTDGDLEGERWGDEDLGCK